MGDKKDTSAQAQEAPSSQPVRASAQVKASELQPSQFVHLHNHTHHSLLDGLSKIPKLVDTVKDMGMEAVAVTDHGTMTGILEFYKTA